MHCSPARRKRHTLFPSLLGAALLVSPGFGYSQAPLWSALGPEGGSIVDLALVPGSPDALFAASFTSGIFKSADGGAGWQPSDAGLVNAAGIRKARVTHLRYSPSAPAILYAGALNSGVLLFKSVDAGQSWTAIDDELSTLTNRLDALAVDPLNPDILYVGGPPGVLKSSDGGQSWNLVNAGLTIGDEAAREVAALAIHPGDPLTLYAGTDRGVYRSTDGAASWIPANDGLNIGGSGGQPAAISDVVIAPSAPERLYALPDRGNVGIFRSLDGGDSWTLVVTGLVPAEGFILSVEALAVDPADPQNLVSAGPGRVYRSDDGGETWTAQDTPPAFDQVRVLVFDPAAEGRLFAATENGVFRSEDGGQSWNGVNAGLRAQTVSWDTLTLDPADADRYYVAGSRLFRSDDRGAVWQDVSTGLPLGSRGPFDVAISPSDPDRLYATPDFPYRSDDGGQTWLRGADSLDPEPIFFTSFLAIDADPRDADVAVAGYFGFRFSSLPELVRDGGIYRTTDGGSSWRQVFDADSGLATFQPNNAVRDPTDPDRIFFGVHERKPEDEGEFVRGVVLRSEDGGLSFARVLEDVVFPAVAVDAAGTVFAGGSSSDLTPKPGVWRSSDHGDTWVPVNRGLPDPPRNVLAIDADPEIPGLLYLSQGPELYVSRDNGRRWRSLEREGLPDPVAMFSLEVPPRQPRTLLAAGDGGVYEGAVVTAHPDESEALVRASVLPGARAVELGARSAAVFAAMVNEGPETARGCGIERATDAAVLLAHQSTDPLTNAAVGEVNALVDIPAGGSHTFAVYLNPLKPLDPTELRLDFYCDNAYPAESIPGLNTVLLSATDGPVPDLVAMAVTPSGDGLLRLTGEPPMGAFAVAASNVGAGGQITVTADTGGVDLPVSIGLCESDPATGACVNPSAPSDAPVVGDIPSGADRTYAVMVAADGAIPLFPETHRVVVHFRDETGAERGRTSVAVTTP